MNVFSLPAAAPSPPLRAALATLGHALVADPRSADLALADICLDAARRAPADALREHRRDYPLQPILVVLPARATDLVPSLLAAGADEILTGEADEPRLRTAIAVAVHRAARQPVPISEPDRRLREIVDSAPDTVAILSESGVMRFANAAHERLLGYNPRELAGINAYEFMHPDDVEPARAALARMLADPLSQDEVVLRMRHARGHWVPLEIAARELRDDAGQVEGVVVIGRELTARVAAETALRESETRLRGLFEASPDLIAIIDNDAVFRAANPAFQRLLGRDPAALIGTSAFDIRDPDEAGLITDASNYSPTVIMPARLLHADGHWVTLEVSAAAMHDESGQRTGMVVVARDASERDAAIAALRASEARFRNVVETSPDLIAVVGNDGQVVFANSAHERILGLDLATFTDARAMVSEEDARRIALASERDPGRFVQARVRHAGGHAVPVEICMTPVVNDAGEREGVITIARDLRERLAAEDEMRRLEERFSRAFHFAPYGSFITDPSGLIIDSNERAAQMLGRPLGDVIGKTTAELQLWADADVRREIINEVLHGDQPVRREVQLVRSDGAIRDIALSMVAMDLAGQEVLLTAAEDVSEQKRAREAVARLSTILSVEQEASIDAILVVDDDRRAITWNQRFLQLWGMTDAVVRAGLEQRVGAVASLLADPAEITQLVQDTYARPDSILDREVSFRDGRVVEAHSAPLIGADGTRYGRVWAYRDITARRNAENELRASEERYRELVEVSPSAIAVHQDGRAVYVNAAGLALFDASFDELAGHDILSFVHPDDRERVRLQSAARVDGRARFLEARLVRLDGTVLDVEIASVPTIHRGRPATQTVVHDVTERNQAREALAQSERRFALAFAAGGVASAISKLDGVYVDVNERFLELVGRRRDEVIGSTAVKLGIWPSTVDRKAYVERLRSDGETKDVEIRIHTAGGNPLDVLISSALVILDGEECILSSMVDITLRKRAEAAIRESEERYRQIVELSPDPMVVTDGALVLYANRAMCDLVGAETPAQVIGAPTGRFVHKSDWDSSIERRERLLGGEITPFEPQAIRTLHDEVRQVEVAAVPIVYEGVRAFQAVFRDMTEIRRREEDRLALERKMLEAQKLESLGVLAGGIAHDFNNLLVAIMGNAGLADLETDPDSPVHEYLSEIQTASQRAADLARQMLAYSGKGRFVVQPMDLTKAVAEMAHLLSVSLPKKANLTLDLAQHLPPVEADSTQVRQIVMNLVINAGEAIGEDDGVITVSTGVLDASPEYLATGIHAPELPGGRYVYLEVADTGCGMDEATLKRIFDPFFTTKFTGRGLGLAAVLGIVRGHHGSMLVQSRPGAGSTFRLLLPAHASSVPQPAPAPPQDAWKGAGRVLLADDEDTVRQVAARMLQRIGLEVVHARDGAEAVEQFTTAANLDLVLLDLMMPRLDGEEAFAAIRRVAPGVPVVIMSGYSQQEAANRFLGREVAGFLQKPFTFAELHDVVRKALG